MSPKTVLADYEPWPVADNEDHRRETMTAADYAIAQFLDSLTEINTAKQWKVSQLAELDLLENLSRLADADAAMTNSDVAEARQNTFINKEF